ncbi:MAG: DUF4097 family beta strand repeat-containing protein [Planctomycetota bacterium]
MRRYILSAVIVATVLAAGCVRVSEDFSLTRPWTDYQRVEVLSRNGPVEVRSAEVAEVEITGRKHATGATLGAARENLARLTIDTAPHPQHADTLVIALTVPEDLRTTDVGARIIVRVPQRVAASATTSNGSIRLEQLGGPIQARTSNGSVRIAGVSGPVEARTSNGSVRVAEVATAATLETSNGRIDAENIGSDLIGETSNGSIHATGVRGAQCRLTTSNGRIDLTAEPGVSAIELRSSNGSIHAAVPRDLAADVRLRTSNGRVRMNMPVTVVSTGDLARSRLAGALNGGGGKLSAETSNGSITIDPR